MSNTMGILRFVYTGGYIYIYISELFVTPVNSI